MSIGLREEFMKAGLQLLWMNLHVANLLLFPLFGLAAFYLVKDTSNRAATISKIAIGLFIPLYARRASPGFEGNDTALPLWFVLCGQSINQTSSSSRKAMTALHDLPRGRRTGSPRSRSQRWTVRTALFRYCATSFQEL